MRLRKRHTDAITELTEAIRYTVEYVGTDTLPPIPGWSWYDALSKYAPDVALQFVREADRLAAIREREARR